MEKVGKENRLKVWFCWWIQGKGKWQELRKMARKGFNHWSMDSEGSEERKRLWTKIKGARNCRS